MLTSPALAVDGFQDAKWGMSPDQVRAAVPAKACRKNLTSFEGFDELDCHQTVGGVEGAEVWYFFREEKLEQVLANLSRMNEGVPIGSNILAGLLAKYGPPDSGSVGDSACTSSRRFGPDATQVRWRNEGIDAVADDLGEFSAVHICYVEPSLAEAVEKARIDAAKTAVDKAASGL
jgi:hypothetical protein